MIDQYQMFFPEFFTWCRQDTFIHKLPSTNVFNDSIHRWCSDFWWNNIRWWVFNVLKDGQLIRWKCSNYYQDMLIFSISGCKTEIFTLLLKATISYPEVKKDIPSLLGEIVQNANLKTQLVCEEENNKGSIKVNERYHTI